MNKKFSTFLAGVALLSAMSVSAAPGDAVQSLKLGKNAGLYQLTVAGDKVLSMDADGKLTVVAAPTTSTGLANTLWCVEVATQVQGQAPKFDFVNKGTERRLDITMAGLEGLAEYEHSSSPIEVGGEISGWAFSKTYEELVPDMPLFSYFKADSVVGFVLDGEKVAVAKSSAKDASVTTADFAKFTLKSSKVVTLNAEELNTILGIQTADKGVKLTFKPDTLGTSLENPFSSQKFVAEDSGDPTYLNVKRGDNYLRVDTTFTNEKGARFLAYKWTTAAVKATSTIAEQYKFKFTYSPSNDSLTIQVKKAKFDNGRVLEAFVSLQDLIKNEARILTVDTLAQNTMISLGFKGCNEVSNRTSIASDLYVIKNAANKYLAVPLYGDSTAQWVTLDKNMDPWHMPAFQWVVEKTRTNAEMAETSPIKITNREFENVVVDASLQLYTDGPSTVVGSEISASNFTKDPANVKANPYVGYRFLDKDSLTVTTYKLRYLHEFADDKYMGTSSDAADSVLYVGAKSTFELAAMDEDGVGYGYTTSAIASMKKLVRKAYTLKLKSTGKYIMADAEKRYAVSATGKPAVFYLKENNDKATHYYALIDTASYTDVRKVGVDDNNVYLKVQNLKETRTSAFSVEIDDAPLYRRFNNVALGESAVDGPDSLRFYENIRHEYLMDETNKELKNEGVAYLGIWTADKAEAGLSFRIDAVNITSGLGYIKPQYLISVSRQDQEAVEGTPCTENSHHVDADGNPTDAAHCVHATPGKAGFEYGKYLVSFADSVATVGQDKPYTDVKAGYTRVGFVKAIKTGDSLIILVNGFENMDPKDLNVEEIVKAYTKAGINTKYINSLKGDNHKNYTWSFRYTNPDGASTVTEEGVGNSFLIESNNYDGKIIAPEKAAWIKMQNGCIVLADEKSEFNNAKTGGDGALIFNVENIENDEMATDTEDITTSAVTVIAGNGDITIKGAANKTVTISNVLGQTIASTVLSSDEATISAPAGIVVVAVEGEAAVKAIVK